MNIRRLVAFLKGLKLHNNKPWFDAHREEYDALRAEFADEVQRALLLIGKFDSSVRSLTPRECVFRINRDVRFSRDKSPYKTHMSAYIAPGGRNRSQAGYYFHVDAAGKLLVAGGLYDLDGPRLAKIRASIDRQPKKLRSIVNAKAFKQRFGGLAEAGHKLKTAPRGFKLDHPEIGLLQLTRFVAWVETPASRAATKGLGATVAESGKALYPLVTYLREATA